MNLENRSNLHGDVARVLRRLALMVGLLPAMVWPLEGQTPFRVTVVDRATGRGVPLVELETVNHLLYVTDNAGVVAFDEPGLLGRRVFFSIRSHGYRFAEDGFGYAGVALDTEPGGTAHLEIERVQIAERLYRITGQGLFGHSRRLGDTPPLRRPLLSGGVLGQDSVQVVPWRGGLFWVFGDTSRAAYPLGNFAASGARSARPDRGGLDPAVGVDLEYITDAGGFSRGLCPIEGPGPVWLDGLCVVPDREGREHLVCHYVRVKTLGVLYEQGLASWDQENQVFVPVLDLPLDAALHPLGHVVYGLRHGHAELIFANPTPAVRLPATWEAFRDPSCWEGFTCLEPGDRWTSPQARRTGEEAAGTGESGPAPRVQIERDGEGRVVWGWKSRTAWIDAGRQRELLRAGLLDRDERWIAPRDPETGREILLHAGSIAWNAYRRRWVMIACEQGGESSFLGEIWYLEADTLTGPWAFARKVVTHDRYSFYNPLHHPFFDQQEGRLIYFEGTFTRTFSRAPRPVPRYDYNQVMYRLDLADPRLALPAPLDESKEGRPVRRVDPGETARLSCFVPVRVDPPSEPADFSLGPRSRGPE